jgi:hypothetical protein
MSVKVLARKFELPDDCITQILTASSFEQASTRYSTVMTRQPKKVPRKVISARDLQILDMRSKGSTLDEIGGQFEITRERVRQIILKHARNEKFITPAEVKISEKLNALKAIRIEISANWNIYRRYSVTSLAKEYKLNESDLLKCVNKVQYAYLKANDESHIEKIWTKESCIRVLKDAATYAFPLTLLEYRKLVNSKTIEGPTLPIFVSRFGSWMEACRAAGVETGTPVREYDTNWSDTDLLLVVRRFMWETRDTAWSIDNYKKWRNKQDPKVASISILRLRLGPWSEIRVLALDLNAPDYDMAIFEELETHEE